jgi:hypothetical protein
MAPHSRALLSAALLASLALAARPAYAETSVAAGYFVPTPNQQKSLGVMATTGLSLPAVPIAPQVTLAVPFSGGRYALTGEARLGTPSTYVGAGAGFGRLNSASNTGGLYAVFIGERIAPLTTVEARFYGSDSQGSGSSGFIGVRIAI